MSCKIDDSKQMWEAQKQGGVADLLEISTYLVDNHDGGGGTGVVCVHRKMRRNRESSVKESCGVVVSIMQRKILSRFKVPNLSLPT